MATLEVRSETKGSAQGPRRTRAAIRRISPWSVLKMSLIFYFCLLLVVLFGLAILYSLLGAFGVLDATAQLLTDVGFGGDRFEFHGFQIFRTLFLIGFITVVIGSALTVFVALLYNLISDLVGGIEVTLDERR